MKVTKEMYEKIVRVCNNNHDLAHDVSIEIMSGKYDKYQPLNDYKINRIKILLLNQMKKKSNEENMISINVFGDETVADLISNIRYLQQLQVLEYEEIKRYIDAFKSSETSNLTNGQKKCIDLAIYFVESCKPYKEISQELGCSPACVKNCVERGLRLLRRPELTIHIKEYVMY